MDHKPIYKTAEELGIEPWEHDGLVALVGPLSRGLVQLDMEKPMCGSVGCIGGNVAVAAGISPATYVYMRRKSCPITDLYFPGGIDDCGSVQECHHRAWKATAPQAARAIVNFLVTGDPQWNAVMASP